MKMIAWIFLQGFLTLLIFVFLIANSGLSGGHIGMTPLTVLIVVITQCLICSAIYLVFKHFINITLRYSLMIIGLACYEVLLALFIGTMPITTIFLDKPNSIYKYYSIAGIFSVLVVLVFFFLASMFQRRQVLK